MRADSSYVVVIGGVNIDIGGRSDAPLIYRDSNPGRVSVSLGGVGRNIAHNLSLLGVKVRLLTALGDDAHADEIRRSCGELGIDLSLSLTAAGCATSTYLYLEDSGGELALAVTDTRLCDRITPEYLSRHMGALNGAAAIFADANLTAKTLAYIAAHCTAPLFSDPVSVKKAGRIKPILGRIHTLKPNRYEAELLAGVKITDEATLKEAINTLLGTGLKRLFLSLGEHGVYAAEGDRRIMLPPSPAVIRSTNGAGDAFTAALGWAYLNGMSLEDTCRAANTAAAIALESDSTINPMLCADAVRERMCR